MPPEQPPSRPAAPDRSAPPRGAFETPTIAPGAQDGGKGGSEGSSGGGWLSNLLTRASREGDDTAHNGDRDTAKPVRPALPKERLLPDDPGLQLGIEPVDALSIVDIARWIDHEAAADLWERYNRGERNLSLSSRRLYTPQGRKAFEDMRRRYKSDHEFRDAVDRYIGEFDRFLGEVGHESGGLAMARNYIISEAGQVYTMLAHAAGRFE
jgi:hypothetical protein